ncbi:hypothetical protein JRQ81_004796 [Phrynocephalus forsythii]|uniref:BTB domain-containing protein n=1 Tax=Phrynocephalus forsythii TaxID=171643 RepID=A0A9Q0XFZ5_9SAUR|nr:hypothetical protein JRQ81_004796 [Phrynocephalus forsythii]
MSVVVRGLATLHGAWALFDVILMVGSSEFRVHWTIPATTSGYFHAMFVAGLWEAWVQLHSIEPKCLAWLLNFTYIGGLAVLEAGGPEGLAEGLLCTGDLLQFPDIKVVCGTCLAVWLEPAATLELEDFGKAFTCAPLAEVA